MRIKRLKLSGFKSFVEPAELRIEPGLTGVVGPNGCGKSNLLEAFRWVMGESSAKSLRGGGMEDVIFAGTSTRPARDFAEVSMLTERTGADGGEVEVVRRIERGAGSAYRINGRDVRAKDVGLLFADAATGAHSPALVSQGKIAAVIAAKPDERRQMLEEAAGIAGLHVRRKDAEQKLRATEANLARLDELLADMEGRANGLRRQARAAERYRLLSDQIRLTEARLIFARWRDAAAAAEAAKKEAIAAETAVTTAAEVQRDTLATQASATRTLADARAVAEAHRERAATLRHDLATLRSEKLAAERRISEIAAQRETLARDQAREDTLAVDAAAALARLSDEEKSLLASLNGAEGRRSESERRVADAGIAVREAEVEMERALALQATELADARIARAAVASARQRLDRANAECQRIARELAALGEDAPLLSARDDARARRGEAEAKAGLAASAIAAAEQARDEAAALRDAAEGDRGGAKAALAALEAEGRALAKALETGGGGKAVARVRAAPGYERALAAALGDDLDATVGGEGARSWRGAEALAADPALPPGGDVLAAHVAAPPELGRRLAQVLVVDTDDHSIALAVGQRLVTRGGALRRWDGFLARDVGAAAAERLIRANRLDEIKQALPAARAALESAEAALADGTRRMVAARQAIDAGRAALAAAESRLRQATRDEDTALSAIERLASQRSALSGRDARAAAERSEGEAALAAAEAVAAALPDGGVVQRTIELLRGTAEAKRAAHSETRAAFTALVQGIEADRRRLDAAKAEAKSWRSRAGDAARRVGEMQRRSEAIEKEAVATVGVPEALSTRVENLTGESEAADVTSEGSRVAERQAEEALRIAERHSTQANEALAITRETRAGAVARLENHETHRMEMSRISAERFECPAPVLAERIGFDGGDVGRVELESGKLERLTADRERIGPVNLLAEAELRELEEGRAGSLAEREELGHAINQLRGSIGSLNKEGRARLLAAFTAVDEHFRGLFTTLFAGGEAHLALIDSDDPLEAGLEIMAQPPGKRLGSLTLLSGGEQALTAVALVFALFLTNPAPICVLDEVDAPLDDANVERFCDLLDRMTRETETRYLIVTHNALTMSRMHRLFGVTMIERGVSRLVSVDLGAAETLLAAE